MGGQDTWSNVTLSTSVRVSFGKINIWSSRLAKAHLPPPPARSMVGLAQSAEGLNRTKRPMLLLSRGTTSCLCISPSCLCTHIKISDPWTFRLLNRREHWLSQAQALGIELNNNHRLSPGWQEILGLLSHRHHMSQFLTNLFLYVICTCTCTHTPTSSASLKNVGWYTP